jgi:hypothetical protein
MARTLVVVPCFNDEQRPQPSWGRGGGCLARRSSATRCAYDSRCGAKIFRATDAVRGAFDTPFVSRWIFDVELLARFVRRKRAAGVRDVEPRLYEVPLPKWHDKKGSKLRTADFCRALLDLWRIRRTLG